MKPTHIARERQTVTAWQYTDKSQHTPIWVARKVHDLDDGKFTANTVVGPLPVNPTDYVVLADEETNSIVVVTAAEFERDYETLPQAG